MLSTHRNNTPWLTQLVERWTDCQIFDKLGFYFLACTDATFAPRPQATESGSIHLSLKSKGIPLNWDLAISLNNKQVSYLVFAVHFDLSTSAELIAGTVTSSILYTESRPLTLWRHISLSLALDRWQCDVINRCHWHVTASCVTSSILVTDSWPPAVWRQASLSLALDRWQHDVINPCHWLLTAGSVKSSFLFTGSWPLTFWRHQSFSLWRISAHRRYHVGASSPDLKGEWTLLSSTSCGLFTPGRSVNNQSNNRTWVHNPTGAWKCRHTGACLGH